MKQFKNLLAKPFLYMGIIFIKIYFIITVGYVNTMNISRQVAEKLTTLPLNNNE